MQFIIKLFGGMSDEQTLEEEIFEKINIINKLPKFNKENCLIDKARMKYLQDKFNFDSLETIVIMKSEKHELLLYPELFEYFGNDGNLVNGQFDMEKHLFEYDQHPLYLMNVFIEVKIGNKTETFKVSCYEGTL